MFDATRAGNAGATSWHRLKRGFSSLSERRFVGGYQTRKWPTTGFCLGTNPS